MTVVNNLKTVLAAHLSIEALTGPQLVIPAVLGHLPLIEELCKTSRGSDRTEILRFASKFVEFCGWLYQDSGDFYCAMKVTDKALEYAIELNDARVTSYILMRKSNIASDNDEPGQALGLANAALVNQEQLTPRLSAIALRQLANSYAMLGELGEFLASSDSAMNSALEGTEQQEPDRAPYCSPAYIAMETAGAWLSLGEPLRALDIISDERAPWTSPEQARDHVLRLARTSMAHAMAGNRDCTVQATEELLAVVPSITSARIAKVLQQLKNELGRWQTQADVADLQARLGQSIRSTSPLPTKS